MIEWKSVKEENPDVRCIDMDCNSDNIWYYIYKSFDETYEDYRYECRDCGLTWWIEGSDY